MTLTLSPPDTALDLEPLVERWHALLDQRGRSALGSAALRGELRQVAAWLQAGLDGDDGAALARAGEQVVELGLDSAEALAEAQGALVAELRHTLPAEALTSLAPFNAAAFRALQRRLAPAAPPAARDPFGPLAVRVTRALAAPRPDELTLVAEALALVSEAFGARGAGLFEWRGDRWSLQQAHGALPAAPFIQPARGEPPLLDDGLPQLHTDRAGAQVAAPLRTDSYRGALLFVALADAPPDAAPLLDALALVGHSLGAALDRLSLHSLLAQQASSLRALEAQTQRQATRGAGRSHLGLAVNAQGETQRLQDVPDLPPNIEAQRVVLPLAIRGEPLGKLLLEDEQPRQWSEDELELMSAVAEQMAQALDAAYLLQESQRRAAQLEAAAEVSRAASSLLSLDELMRTTVEQIRRTFGYYHAQVFLLDDEGQWAVLRSSTGEVGQKLLARNHRLQVGSRSIIGQVTARAQPTVVRDTDAGSGPWAFNELLPHTRAELAVPLRAGTTVIGALDVQSLSPNVFYEEDIAVLQTLADQLAVAIQNARAFERQRESAEQLREVDKLKTQFLANMSHELRTPLNSIIGFSRVILKGIDGPVTELQRKDLTTIYNSGQILLQLIDSILDISKIEAGKMELDFEEVNLHQVIDVALSTAVGLVKDKPVRLVREVADDLPRIVADPVRVRQVLLNLLSNAAKFTEEGHIRLTATRMGDEVMLSVADTGLGIPPDKQAHLFEAFYQVDGSATRKVGGTGLGLAITKSFVEMHGGQIWVESAGVAGEGTTFHVTLPIEGPSAARQAPPAAPLVLAVDDEPGITMLYEKYLAPEGYRFAACHDPRRAVEQATELQPQLILLDLRMPGATGFEVLAALRRNLLTQDVPVIICSIEATDHIEDEGLQAGASAFLQKPVLRQELVGAVQRWAGVPAG